MVNELLRTLRHKKQLTQAQLAELVRASVAGATGKRCDVDANWISRLERGTISWPNRDYRSALRKVLGVETDADLGLCPRSLQRPPPAAAQAEPREPVPRQLPAPPQSFTGRTNELITLTNTLNTMSGRGETVMISALAGAGGIGKTWLALHWAHQHLDQFPDGQLFVDLQGFSPAGEPMEAAVAVRGFLDAFGVVPSQIPADAHAQAALYRSLIAGKRMLILLDNAANAAQVVPLLPGKSSCTVVVTSRQRLTSLTTRHNAHHLRIGALTDTEAHQLLVTRLGADRVEAEPEAVAELRAGCGGFPLALGILAGRLNGSPDVPLAELAADLRDTTTRLGILDDDDPAASLPAVLSWSTRALTSEQARMFELLGIAPGPDISRPAAFSLAGLPTAHTDLILRGLEQASLLDREPAGRYRMHDLIRLYASEQAYQNVPDASRTAALQRLVLYYSRTAYAGERLLDPYGEPIRIGDPLADCHPHHLNDEAAALVWFTAEHSNLLATQQMAAGTGWHTAVWQLAWALDTFQFRHGYLRDQIATWEAGLDSARHLTERDCEITAHRQLGYAFASGGQHSAAIAHLHHALSLAEHSGDILAKAQTHRGLALAWTLQLDDQQALEHATHALHLLRTLDNPMLEAEALNDLGWCSARLGHLEQARIHCEAALALLRTHHARNGEANTLDSLGYIAYRAGQYTDALGCYHQALVLYREVGNACGEADTLDRLGHTYQSVGQFDDARAAWQLSFDLYGAQHRTNDAARIQHQLADLGTDRRDHCRRSSSS